MIFAPGIARREVLAAIAGLEVEHRVPRGFIGIPSSWLRNFRATDRPIVRILII
jgi:hypothetical protein